MTTQPTPEGHTPTDYALPKVSKETADSVMADANDLGIDGFIQLAQERLQVNNPELYDGMGSFAVGLLGPNPSPQAIRGVHDVMIMTHELLRRQSESDALGRMVGSSDQ